MCLSGLTDVGVCSALPSPLLLSERARGRRFIGTVPRSSFFRATGEGIREGSEVERSTPGLNPCKVVSEKPRA